MKIVDEDLECENRSDASMKRICKKASIQKVKVTCYGKGRFAKTVGY